jgi:alginate O-acetyltransferase complex protein AlgI
VLFNSYAFILFFLPITLVGFFVIARASHLAAAAWLAAASVAFYGWWNVAYVGLLLGSVCGNFFFGTQIARAVGRANAGSAHRLLIAAVASNLLVLAYYKYANFFIANVNGLAGTHWSVGSVILPLGISFFTFTQIAFLVDTYRGHVHEYRFVHYALFVTYFPHLIAGPVLHHKEMMPQFARGATYQISAANLSVGLSIFAIGLAKKALLADGIAPYADQGFRLAATAAHPSFFYAWSAALCYTLQLYFDFSGYSDMAIGLSRLFGVTLPLNFYSPYKAVNISEFWRRWHMTLSRFLRDYLYVALGGNRHGAVRRYRNLMITMLLGGLWHGAGWTFVAWGGLHGLYLVVNHAWLRLKSGLGVRMRLAVPLRIFVARLVTLLAVIVGWVFFRSSSFTQALELLAGMSGLHGASLPGALERVLGPLAAALRATGIAFDDSGSTQFVRGYLWVAALLPVALFAPNVAQLMRQYRPTLDQAAFDTAADERRVRAPLAWTPSRTWALIIAGIAAAALLSLFHVSEFLYYQF